jgi:hypothetical protein
MSTEHGRAQPGFALLSGAGFSPSINSIFRVFGASEGRHLHG